MRGMEFGLGWDLWLKARCENGGSSGDIWYISETPLPVIPCIVGLVCAVYTSRSIATNSAG